MSTELAIAAERGQSLAELMGVTSTSGESSPSIARLNLIHQPIMGEVEFNGKTIKTEVVPIGAFILKSGDDTVYATSVSIRVFAQRQQWQHWNSETEEMEKSVLATNLNGDLKDSTGGFNLGRPSGYVEDFNALPDATKQLMRSVKRVKIFYGTVTLHDPVDAQGEAVSGDFKDIPFVMDVKNRDSMKSIDGVLNVMQRKNMLPIMAYVNLEGVEDSIPTGAKFGKIKASMGDRVDIQESDNDTLRNFIELIEYANGKIIDLYTERTNKGLSKEDAAVVKDIMDAAFVEVEE